MGGVAERAYSVDTPACEFSATTGVLASGRASGVSPVRGGANPPSGSHVASSITALFKLILMILTYPTQNLVKKKIPSLMGFGIWGQRYELKLKRLYYLLGEIYKLVKIMVF